MNIRSYSRCISADRAILDSLPGKARVRLVQNLIRLIELSMDAQDADNMAIGSLIPWIILYQFIAR